MREKKNVKSSAIILNTDCLNQHPERSRFKRWSKSVMERPLTSCHWSWEVKAGNIMGTKCAYNIGLLLQLFLCLKSLKLLYYKCCLNGSNTSVPHTPLPFSCLHVSAPLQPQSSSVECFCIFNCLSDMPCPHRPWWAQLFGNLSAGQSSCQQDFLCSPSSDFMRGVFQTLWQASSLFTYCKCSDLCAIVYQISLPLSRWVFISVSYPL